MSLVDTKLSMLEDDGGEGKEDNKRILNEYNQYLNFLEKYFSDKNALPLKKGEELIKQIFD